MKLLRTAIYARYSSELQNPTSVKDQILLCRHKAKIQFGLTDFVDICYDEAITGETLNRPGLQKLLNLIDHGLIDLIISEGLDRVSRKAGQLHYIFGGWHR